MSRQNFETSKLCVIFAILVSTGIWPGAVKAAEDPLFQSQSGQLAVIDGKPITINDFQEVMTQRPGEYDAESKKELLESLVRNELLFAAAKRAGYERDPEVIQAVKQLMVGKYLRDNLEGKQAQLAATEPELVTYYQTNLTKFGTRAMVHAALIRINVSPKASTAKKDELLKRAETARRAALALEPGVPAFGSIAMTYSEDQDSRYRGGDIGWVQMGTVDDKWDKKVADAILALATPGQVSPIIHAEDGYYIVKLIEKKEASFKPFAEVRDGVGYLLLQEKKERLENDFIEQLKSRISVTVNFALLQTLTLPAEESRGVPPALPGR